MNTLEDRLRTDLRAESELIAPDSIRPLSLTGAHGRRPGRLRRRGTWRWPAWATPVAAAAAVAAVIVGTITVSHLVTGGGPANSEPVALSSYSHLPPYYATTVQGNVVSYVYKGSQDSSSVLGRYLKLHATQTGRLVATISPPKPYNDFIVLSGDADGRTYVLAAERYFGFRGPRSPHTGALDAAAPVRFFVLRIDSGGHAHMSDLALPFTILPNEQPSLALSPDGSRLAVAYGGDRRAALVRVVSVATGGVVRQWAWPGVSWTPLINVQGAWTADGRTLVFQQWYVTVGQNKPPGRTTPLDTTPTWLLDTAAPSGAGRGAAKLLLLRYPAGMNGMSQPFITPDGRELIAAAEKSPRRLTGSWLGEFAAYSTRTGALAHTSPRWTREETRTSLADFPRPGVVWSDGSGGTLLVIQPHGGLNRLGVLTGNAFKLTGSHFLPTDQNGYNALQSTLQRAGGIPPSTTW